MNVTVQGVEWRPFAVEFDTQEGVFSFHLYAVDWAHALDRLEELKASARITMQVQEIIPA